MAQRYKDRQKVKGGTAKRAKRRLAAIRARNPQALSGVSPKGGYTGREARAIKRAARPAPRAPRGRGNTAPEGSGLAKRTQERYESIPDIPGVNLQDGITRREARRVKRGHIKAGRPRPFDPLTPLTGKDFAEETKAAELLEFGELDRDLKQRTANQRQTTANTATYYDDFRRELSEATGRINATNQQHIGASEQRVDAAHSQDSEAVKARDTADSSQAALLGRGPVASNEGAQAVEAARSQGNQQVSEVRQQAAADTSLMEKRGVNARQGKIEAVQRENARSRVLGEEGRSIARNKGSFRTTQRTKARESEREWAAVKQEFKIKTRGQALDAGATRGQQRTERMRIRADKTIERMRSATNRAEAKAQIRVAKLQLRRGEIDANQFKTIRNIYEGLPSGGGGSGGGGRSGPGSSSGGAGSGRGGNWSPSEVDQIQRSVESNRRHRAGLGDKQKMLALAKKNGMSPRLANAAWRNYVKKYLKNTDPNRNYGP